MPPLKTVAHVDLPRFMGRWYVIANISNFFEKEAFGSIETYTLRPDGKIDVLFTFNRKAFDGEPRRMTQVGWVHDTTTNAEWRVRPLWPLSLAYLIIDLADDYSWTAIGYPNRKLVWIMAREKTLPDATYAGIIQRLVEQGYDAKMIQKVPQPL